MTQLDRYGLRNIHTGLVLVFRFISQNVCSREKKGDLRSFRCRLWFKLFIVVKRQFVALPRAVPHNASCKYTNTRQQGGLLQSLLMQWWREYSLPSALYRKVIKNTTIPVLEGTSILKRSRKSQGTNMFQKIEYVALLIESKNAKCFFKADRNTRFKRLWCWK